MFWGSPQKTWCTWTRADRCNFPGADKAGSNQPYRAKKSSASHHQLHHPASFSLTTEQGQHLRYQNHWTQNEFTAILSTPSRAAPAAQAFPGAGLRQRPPWEAPSYVRNRRRGGSAVPVSPFSTGPGITQFALCWSIKGTGGTCNHSQLLNFSDKPAGQEALPFQGQIPPTPRVSLIFLPGICRVFPLACAKLISESSVIKILIQSYFGKKHW